MTQLPWILLSEKPVLDGFTRVIRQTYRMPDGRESEWDVVAGDRSVAVVAMTTDGSFVTVRQFRPGPGRVLDELPGGYVDSGERVEHAAARELLEETGYEAGTIELVGSSWMSAKGQLRQFCAVARDCRYSGPARSDAEEFMDVRLVDLATLLSIVRSGGLTDQGLAYRALDHLGLLQAGC